MSDESSCLPSEMHFPTTAWSVLDAFPDQDDPSYQQAMNAFIQAYWKPVFYFLRARGHPLHQAEDLTQGFFLHFLARDVIHRVERSQCRKFRSFLLGVLKHYVSNEAGARATRQKRHESGLVAISTLLGEAERAYEPASGETPERAYTRQWAEQLLRQVREQLYRRCQDEDRGPWYEVFRQAVLDPGPQGPPSQEALGRQLGLTRDQVRYALEQVQQMYVQTLRKNVASQVVSEEEVGEEIRELLAILAG